MGGGKERSESESDSDGGGALMSTRAILSLPASTCAERAAAVRRTEDGLVRLPGSDSSSRQWGDRRSNPTIIHLPESSTRVYLPWNTFLALTLTQIYWDASVTCQALTLPSNRPLSVPRQRTGEPEYQGVVSTSVRSEYIPSRPRAFAPSNHPTGPISPPMLPRGCR